jgi:hypothetical protein
MLRRTSLRLMCAPRKLSKRSSACVLRIGLHPLTSVVVLARMVPHGADVTGKTKTLGALLPRVFKRHFPAGSGSTGLFDGAGG